MTDSRAVGVAAVLCLFVVGRASAESSEPRDKFIRDVLAAIPEPDASEFPTPDRVAEQFVRAVNANDVSAGMRCFAIRNYFRAYDMVAFLGRYGLYDAGMSGMPLPEHIDDVDALLFTLRHFSEMWSRMRRAAFVASNPKMAQPFTLRSESQTPTASGDKVDSEAFLKGLESEAREKLAPIQNARITVTYKVKVRATEDWKSDPVARAMGVEQNMVGLILDVQLVGTEDTPTNDRSSTLFLKIGKIGSNWRILGGLPEMRRRD